ncbi:MAG: hypothetical protein ACP5OP_03970 [Leptospirillia bacterium]
MSFRYRLQGRLGHFWLGILTLVLLGGCMMQKAPVSHVNYSDGAPHPLPPLQKEKFFDGSLYEPGTLGDLASDDVASQVGDPIVIRFGPKNGYPGLPQSRTTRLAGEVVRVEPSDRLLVSAQRTIRDGSSLRRIVLVGRVSRSSIESSNEVPISKISMLRFRSDSESSGGPRKHFSAPPPLSNAASKAAKKIAKSALSQPGKGTTP